MKTNPKNENIVFELRWSNTILVIGRKIGGSQLLRKEEVSWKEVVESPNTVLNKWGDNDSITIRA